MSLSSHSKNFNIFYLNQYITEHLYGFLATVAVMAASGAVMAHDNALHKANASKQSIAAEKGSFGREGDPKKVSRIVSVDMNDALRFSPDALVIKQDETVQFVVKNSGKVMHEMVLGTMQELKGHAEMMRRHPGMEHDEPYMAHVAPGKTGGFVWQFTQAGEFYFGCLVPGHFEAGMIGKVVVK
jgi:uncharacterized cupredoxin-like copper-binding protein